MISHLGYRKSCTTLISKCDHRVSREADEKELASERASQIYPLSYLK